MATEGGRLLGEHYDDEHLNHEEIEKLGLRVVTEEGKIMPPEETQGRIFRIVDRDEPSGYLVKSTGQGTTLCYLQEA